MGQKQWECVLGFFYYYYSVDFMIIERFEFVLVKNQAKCKHQNLGFFPKLFNIEDFLWVPF